MKYDVGILGGGQLARMSAMAARQMGLSCLCLDPNADCPASYVADIHVGELSDPTAIADVFFRCESATLENEFIPAAMIAHAVDTLGIDPQLMMPDPGTLAAIQDKELQRRIYLKEHVPSPPIDTVPPTQLEFPYVIKARFGGYDGKGTRVIHHAADLEECRSLWESGGWYSEAFVPFKRELAVMVCRSLAGSVCFPTMETVQVDNVCDLVFPSGTDASTVAIQAVEAFGGYGLYGVELFELEDGSFQVNEIAPRPHNTGHYTLDWGGMSQFEAHIRLAVGMAVPQPRGSAAAMANLLGQPGAGDFRAGLRAAYEAVPDCHVHWYGKTESRPGRKMGHINAVGADAKNKAVRARAAFYHGWTSG